MTSNLLRTGFVANGKDVTWSVKSCEERREAMPGRSSASMTEESREPLSTQITRHHHKMLDELYGIGMMKNAVIERGIELYYEKLANAGLIEGYLQQVEEQSPND
jgi:hypothetical protein